MRGVRLIVLVVMVLAAPAVASPKLFVGARKGEQVFVLAYDGATRALAPFGPALPIKPRPAPSWQEPQFLYLLANRPDRVFVMIETKDGMQTFGGDGTRWHTVVAAGCGVVFHPYVSSDGESIVVCEPAKVAGEWTGMIRVKRWDGSVLDEWPSQDSAWGGFVVNEQRWIAVTRGDNSRFVRAHGTPQRPATGKERVVGSIAANTDRYVLDEHQVIAKERASGREIARFTAAALPNIKDRGMSFANAAALAGPRAAVGVLTAYSQGRCEDIPCPHALALDVWVVGDGAPRSERLRVATAKSGDYDRIRKVAVDPTASLLVWLDGPNTLGAYDIAKRTRGSVKSDLELVFVQSARR
jgi:hypothetical protein